MSSDLQPLYSLLEEVQTRKSAILLSRPARTDPADFHRYLDHLTVHGSELGDPTRLVDQCIRQAEPDVQALVHSLFEEEQQRWSRAERLLSHRAERPLSPSAAAPAPAPDPAVTAPVTARPVRPRPPQLATERRAQLRRRPPQVRTAPVRHGTGRAAHTERVQRTGPSPGTAVGRPPNTRVGPTHPGTATASPPISNAAVCLSRPRHLADTARAALGTPGGDLRPAPPTSLAPPAAPLAPPATVPPPPQPAPPAPRPPPVLAYEEFETVRRPRRVTQPPLPPPQAPPPPGPLEDDGVRHVHLGLDVSSDASDESEPPPPHGVEDALSYQQEPRRLPGDDEPPPPEQREQQRQERQEAEENGEGEGGAVCPPRPPTSVGADSEPPTPRPPAPAEQGATESGAKGEESGLKGGESGVCDRESGAETGSPVEIVPVDAPPQPQLDRLATGRHRTANTTPGSAIPRPTAATAFSKRRAGPAGDAVWSSVPASAASNRRPVVLRSARSVGGSATQWRDGPPPPPPPSTRPPGSISGPQQRRGDVIASDVTWVPMDADVFCSVGRQRTSREMKKKLEINAYKLIQEVCAASMAGGGGGASPPGSSRSEDGSGSSQSGGRRTARSPAAVAADAVAAELDRALADRRLPVAQYSWASSHSDSVSPSADLAGGAAPPVVAATMGTRLTDAANNQQQEQLDQRQQQQHQPQQRQQQTHQQHEERQLKQQQQERQPTNRQRQQRQEQEQKQQELHASQLAEDRGSRSRSPPPPQKSLPPPLSDPSDTTSEATDPSSKPSLSAPSPPPPLSWSAAGDSDCRPVAAVAAGPASPGDGSGDERSPVPGGGGGGGVPLQRQAPVGGSGHHSAAETDDQVSELESSVVESPPEEARRTATATAAAMTGGGGGGGGVAEGRVYQSTVIQPPVADDCFSALPPSGLRSSNTRTMSDTTNSSTSSTSTSRTPPPRTAPAVQRAVPTALPTAAARRTLPVAAGRSGPAPTPLAPPMKPARAVRATGLTETAAQTSDSLLPPPTAASQHSTDSSAELLSGCCQTTPPPSAASAACQTRPPASPQRRQAGSQTAPTAELPGDAGERLSLSPSPPSVAIGRPPAAVSCWRSQSGTSGLGPTASVEDLSEGEVLWQWPHWVGAASSGSMSGPQALSAVGTEGDRVRPTEQDGADTTLSEGEVTGVTGDTLPVGSSFPSIGTLGPTASQLSVGRRRSSQLTTVPSQSSAGQARSVPSHLSVGQRQSNQLKTVSSRVTTVPSRVTTVPSQSSTVGQVRSADSVSASAARRASSGRVIGAARVDSSLHLSSVRTEQLSERPVPTGEEIAGQEPPDLSDGEMSGSVRVRHVHIRPVRPGDVAGGRRAIDGAATAPGMETGREELLGAESEGALWSDGEAPPDAAV